MAQPFVRGASDCAFFADVVLAMTGHDCLAGGRAYNSERTAAKKLKALGYRSMLELVADHFPEIPPALAQRGDLGFPAEISSPLMSPAVIVGAEAWSKSETGPVMVPRSLIVRAFAV